MADTKDKQEKIEYSKTGKLRSKKERNEIQNEAIAYIKSLNLNDQESQKKYLIDLQSRIESIKESLEKGVNDSETERAYRLELEELEIYRNVAIKDISKRIYEDVKRRVDKEAEREKIENQEKSESASQIQNDVDSIDFNDENAVNSYLTGLTKKIAELEKISSCTENPKEKRECKAQIAEYRKQSEEVAKKWAKSLVQDEKFEGADDKKETLKDEFEIKPDVKLEVPGMPISEGQGKVDDDLIDFFRRNSKGNIDPKRVDGLNTNVDDKNDKESQARKTEIEQKVKMARQSMESLVEEVEANSNEGKQNNSKKDNRKKNDTPHIDNGDSKDKNDNQKDKGDEQQPEIDLNWRRFFGAKQFLEGVRKSWKKVAAIGVAALASLGGVLYSTVIHNKNLALNPANTRTNRIEIDDDLVAKIKELDTNQYEENIEKTEDITQYEENLEKTEEVGPSWEIPAEQLDEITEKTQDIIENQSKKEEVQLNLGTVLRNLPEGLEFQEGIDGGRKGNIGGPASPADGTYIIDHYCKIEDGKIKNVSGTDGKEIEDNAEWVHISIVEGAKEKKPRGWVKTEVIKKIMENNNKEMQERE